MPEPEWIKLPGWDIGFKDIYDYYADNLAQDGDVVVEIGVACGRSLTYLSERLGSKRVSLYAVDPWLPDNGDDNVWPQSLKGIARDLGGTFSAYCRVMASHAPKALERINVLRVSSLQARRMFDDQSLAMVLIDGDHSYEAVHADISTWESTIRPGGILAGDDYVGHPGVKQAVDELFGDTARTVGRAWYVAANEMQLQGEQAGPPLAPGQNPPPLGPQLSVSTGSQINIEKWALVETLGGKEWIGEIVVEDGQKVTLCPAFHMGPSRITFPVPRVGGHGRRSNGYDIQYAELTDCWPPMGLIAQHKVTLYVASIERLAEQSKEVKDRAMVMIAKGFGARPTEL